MADHLLDDPDSKETPLTADLDDDTSLLDGGLTDLQEDEGNEDHDDLLAPTPTDESDHLLDNTTDDDPVRPLSAPHLAYT